MACYLGVDLIMSPLHITWCKRLRFATSKFCLSGTSFTPETLSEITLGRVWEIIRRI